MSRVSRLLGVALVAMTMLACSGWSTDVVDGPAAEDVADEAPYGAGAEIGRTYDYVLLAHCGVHWARIDGVWWETQLLDDGNANPPDGWGNPWDAGTLVMLDENIAEYIGGPGITVTFERTEFVQPPFVCA